MSCKKNTNLFKLSWLPTRVVFVFLLLPSGPLWGRNYSLPTHPLTEPPSSKTSPTNPSPSGGTTRSAPPSSSTGTDRLNLPSNYNYNIQEPAKKLQDSQNRAQAVAQNAAQLAQSISMTLLASCGLANPGACKMAKIYTIVAISSTTVSTLMQLGSRRSQNTINDVGGYPSFDWSLDPIGDRTGDSPDTPRANAKSDPPVTQAARNLPPELVKGLCEKTKTCIDPEKGTITFPNGKTTALDNLSEAALQEGGFSSDEIAKLGGAFNQTFEEAEKTLGLSEATASLDSAITSYQTKPSNPNFENWEPEVDLGLPTYTNRDPASQIKPDSPALTKIFHGQPIAVAQENIFVLISRRYELKAKQDELILTPLRSNK